MNALRQAGHLEAPFQARLTPEGLCQLVNIADADSGPAYLLSRKAGPAVNSELREEFMTPAQIAKFAPHRGDLAPGKARQDDSA